MNRFKRSRAAVERFFRRGDYSLTRLREIRPALEYVLGHLVYVKVQGSWMRRHPTYRNRRAGVRTCRKTLAVAEIKAAIPFADPSALDETARRGYLTGHTPTL